LKKLKPGSFKNTFCVFQEIDPTSITISKFDYTSQSGSSYFYSETGMYRYSNHWGRLANSKWRLEPLEQPVISKYKLGFAHFNDFYPDNATDELYYLEVNFASKTVNYQHKNNPNFDQKAILRTGFETAKKIKQIRNLFALTSWAKYFDYEDLDVLRNEIIQKLIYSNQTLEDIKRDLL